MSTSVSTRLFGVGRLMILVAAIGLVAAACGDSADNGIASSSENNRDEIDSSAQSGDDLDSSAGEAEAEVSGDADEASGRNEAEEEVAPSAAVVDHRTLTPEEAQPDEDGTCLVGLWEISEEELNRWYDSLEQDAGAGFNFQITGAVGVEFGEDRTFTYTPDFVMDMSADGIEASGDTSGALRGTWSAEGGVIVTDITDDSMNIDVRVDGFSIDAGSAGLNEDPIVESPYDCATDEPVLFFSDGAGSRVPMKLTRA